NYRMSNVCAAIGRGQLEYLPFKLTQRLRIYDEYEKQLKGLPVHIKHTSWKDSSNHWLSLLCIENGVAPETVVARLQNVQIESRPAWKPMHMQPLFEGAAFFSHKEKGSVGEDVFATAVCLPSGDAMSAQTIGQVVDEIRGCFA
ncbi:MAG: DegT/DnrJ/EryC1/StrS family aminotransferase, partial [Clostridia bacterium]